MGVIEVDGIGVVFSIGALDIGPSYVYGEPALDGLPNLSFECSYAATYACHSAASLSKSVISFVVNSGLASSTTQFDYGSMSSRSNT